MLIQLDTLNTLPVATADDGRIGVVVDTLIHPDTGELIGFWVQLDGWFAPKRALSSRDIIAYDPQALVITNSDVLLEPKEIQPFHIVESRKERWLGKPVITEAGERLGRVTNLVIDTDLETLAKLHVGSFFGAERILPRSAVVRVSKTAVTVRANVQPAAERVGASQEAVA